MTREEWDLWTRGSAMRRAGYAGFERNVAVAGSGFRRRATRAETFQLERGGGRMLIRGPRRRRWWR